MVQGGLGSQTEAQTCRVAPQLWGGFPQECTFYCVRAAGLWSSKDHFIISTSVIVIRSVPTMIPCVTVCFCSH